MKKFLVTVTQTTEVEVEIDETEMGETWMAVYRDGFGDLYTVKDHAENIGRLIALELENEGDFLEGYGFIRTSHAFQPEPAYSYKADQNPNAPHMNINVRVTALDSDALSYLILDYEGHREWVERWKSKAHDAIEEERLDDAVAYLTRIQQKSARVTKEVYQGLLKEQEERIRRRSEPYWRGGSSGPTW